MFRRLLKESHAVKRVQKWMCFFPFSILVFTTHSAFSQIGDIDAPTVATRVPHHHEAPVDDTNCGAPPSSSYNPYSYQAGFSTDNHTYNPYTTTVSPYSGDPEPNANIFHEPKQPNDEPGHWARGDFKVTGFGNDKLNIDAHVYATIVNAKGDPDNYGDFVHISNGNKAPIYFGLTTSVLNDKIMPGEERTIKLGFYKPRTGSTSPTPLTLNVKYWVSEGAPRKNCSSYLAYFKALDATPWAQYSGFRRQLPWEYTGTFQTEGLRAFQQQFTFPGGRIDIEATPERYIRRFVNLTTKPMFVDLQCIDTVKNIQADRAYVALGAGQVEADAVNSPNPLDKNLTWDKDSCTVAVMKEP